MKLGYKAIKRRQSGPENQGQIIRIEHPRLEGWKNPNGVLYYKEFPCVPKIIKAKITSRHPNNTLVGNLKSKKAIDWPIILLICVTFESLQRNIKTHIKGLLRLLLVKSPGQNYIATSSCYWRQFVNKKMYLSL